MNEQKYFNWDNIKLSRTVNQQSVGTGTVSGTKISDSDFATFIKLLANKVGFKLTDQNIRFLNAWRKAENTKASNNPFATTINYKNDPEMTKFNLANSGQGVKNFSTVEYGADATANTINLRYYTSLVDKLKNPESTAEELAMDPSLRTWGTTSGNPKLILSLIPGAKLDIDDTDTAISNLDKIVNANAIVYKAWKDMYNVFTGNPDKYFGKFSSWRNDQEIEAARWLRVAFRDTWLLYKKEPEKSLYNIRNEMIKDGSADAQHVVDNINKLIGIYKYIYKLILKGKQGRILDKSQRFFYYNPNNKRWYAKIPFKFEWDYM